MFNQWLFQVPLKGGRWHIIPQLAVYTTYIPLIVLAFWGVKNAPYHLLGEPASQPLIQGVCWKILGNYGDRKSGELGGWTPFQMCHGQKSRLYWGWELIPPLMTESLFHGYIGAPTDLG